MITAVQSRFYSNTIIRLNNKPDNKENNPNPSFTAIYDPLIKKAAVERATGRIRKGAGLAIGGGILSALSILDAIYTKAPVDGLNTLAIAFLGGFGLAGIFCGAIDIFNGLKHRGWWNGG